MIFLERLSEEFNFGEICEDCSFVRMEGWKGCRSEVVQDIFAFSKVTEVWRNYSQQDIQPVLKKGDRDRCANGYVSRVAIRCIMKSLRRECHVPSRVSHGCCCNGA